VGLKQRREDQEFMIALNQMQQMVEVVANAVRRLRAQAEARLEDDKNTEESEAEVASEESSVVH
jgi:hypothetical protein